MGKITFSFPIETMAWSFLEMLPAIVSMGKEKVILPIKIRVLDNCYLFGEDIGDLRERLAYVPIMFR